MHVLEALASTQSAYRDTGTLKFLWYMLCHARWYSAITVILVGFLSLALLIKTDGQPNIMLVAMAVAFVWFQKDAYREHSGDPALKLDLVTNKTQGHRFIIFREKLSEELKSDKQMLEKILKLLEQRNQVQQTNVITRNPLSSIILSLLLMLVGSLVSKVAEASTEAIIVGIIYLASVFLIILPFNAVIKSRAYRAEELTEFVLWLWAEAPEREDPSCQPI